MGGQIFADRAASEGRWLGAVWSAVPVLAFVVGGLGLLSVIADFALTPLYALVAASDEQAFADVWVGTGLALWSLRVACSVALAALLVAGWSSRRLSRSSLTLMAAGLLVGWGWWLLTRVLDLWGFGRFAGETEASADLVWLATVSALVDALVAVVSSVLLIIGAVLARRRTAAHAEATHPAPPNPDHPEPDVTFRESRLD